MYERKFLSDAYSDSLDTYDKVSTQCLTLSELSYLFSIAKSGILNRNDFIESLNILNEYIEINTEVSDSKTFGILSYDTNHSFNVKYEILWEPNNQIRHLYLKSISTNNVETTMIHFVDDGINVVLHEDSVLSLQSLSGAVSKISDVTRSLSDNAGYQIAISYLAKAAMSEGLSKNTLIEGIVQNCDINNESVKNVYNTILENFTDDNTTTSNVVSLLVEIYKEMNGATISEDEVAFNNNDYTPKVSWSTIVVGAVSVFAQTAGYILIAISKVAGLALIIGGTICNGIMQWLADETVNTRVNENALDKVFGQPIAITTDSSVWNTQCLNYKTVISSTPLYTEFFWTNDNIHTCGEIYGATWMSKDIINQVRSYFNIYTSQAAENRSRIEVMNYFQDLYRNNAEQSLITLMSYKDLDLRKAVMSQLLIDAWFVHQMLVSSESVVFSPSYSAASAFSPNMLAYYLDIVDTGISWDQFYSNMSGNISEGVYDICHAWMDMFDVVAWEEYDQWDDGVVYSQMMNRNKLFILPARASRYNMIWGIILGAVVIAVGTVAAMIVKTKIKKKLRALAIKRRTDIENEHEELKQWASELKAGNITQTEYQQLYNSYDKKVRKFNFIAGLTGLSKVDAVTTYDAADAAFSVPAALNDTTNNVANSLQKLLDISNQLGLTNEDVVIIRKLIAG